MKLFLSLFFLSITLTSFSQIEVTTKEGKKVFLYKNGTWKYAKTSTKAPVSPAVAVPVVASASSEDLKNEAKEFSVQFITTYFTLDCKTYFTFLSPELISLKSSDNILLTDEVKSKICESLHRAVSDKSKTLQDYLNTYKLELLTRAEVEAKSGQPLPEHFNTTDPEFYVVGFEPKEGSTEAPFIWTDMFVFLIRKTNGTWKMKAPLGG